MDIIITGVVALVGILMALIIGVALHKKQLAKTFENAQLESRKLVDEARKEADRLVKNAIRESKEDSRRRRQHFEDEIKQRRSEIAKSENKIRQREQNLEKKFALIENKETGLEKLSITLKEEEARYKRLISECEKTLNQSRRALQNISNMSPEEAKRELIKSMEAEARKEAQTKIKEIEEQTKQEAAVRARSTVSLAVQRIASEYVNESTVSVVSLPNDEMKGRIIGREGRNIRAIEQATGVDLIIDDTPEAVIISCFNPIRREIAKISLERLIADGRIHPARIEETVDKIKNEMDQVIIEHGEQASFETGITDLHPELLKILGKLQFRTIGHYTLLRHSIEVANISGIIAAEMGVNIKRAKRCGLIHDIGQAVDQETEGHHANIGADICAKYNESKEVITAIREHHAEDVTHLSKLGLIIHTANSLSINRPGARKEVLESHIKRLEDMENLVREFSGIEEAFVFQAGRDIRAMVTPEGVTDDEIVALSQDVVSKLRSELTFPGQVKVTIIRESKFADYAK